MQEIWKNIDGYEGKYQISNLGNVKSLNYGGRGYARNLVPKINNSGRLWVELMKDGKKRQFLIHRLVGMAFIPNPDNLPQINHKDENPKNNRVDNLEWCTNLYNFHYSFDRHPERHRKRQYNPTGKKKVHHNRIDVNVWQIDKAGNKIKLWNDVSTIARELGVHQWSVTQCCNGVRKTAGGFKWQFAT